MSFHQFILQVYLVGVPSDSIKKKTKIIPDNWFPVWDEEFEFPLTVPELALLRIEVREYDKHEKDDFGGQTCLPVLELKSGFRSVPLYDQKGEKLKSVKLLMRFQFIWTVGIIRIAYMIFLSRKYHSTYLLQIIFTFSCLYLLLQHRYFTRNFWYCTSGILFWSYGK